MSCEQEDGVHLSPATAVSSSPVLPSDREIVLVVDDEPAVLSVMRLVLMKSGFQVVAADSAAKALEIFETMRSRIRVVITDMAMPGMSGLDLILVIRKCDADVVIVATTGMTSPEQMKEIREAGVQHVLSKPCSSRTMSEFVRNLFSNP